MTQAKESLSIDEARRVALFAQGLRGARPGGGVPAMLRQLGAVQLDTISVLARSHELVPYARLGAIGRDRVDQRVLGSSEFDVRILVPRGLCDPARGLARVRVPAQDVPGQGAALAHLGRTRGSLRRGGRSLAHRGTPHRKRTRRRKKGGSWWDWSDTKIAAEWLLDIGDLVCRERRGFQRVYDLAERAIPAELRSQDRTDEECSRHLVSAAGRSLGVATEADLSMYHGVPRAMVHRAVTESELVPVSVEGWKQPAFADPAGLASLGSRARGRSVMLSPFDPLIWFRARVERLFGLRHRLEAYTPKEKRVYGYFAMPVLGGTKIVGLVDPGRRGEVLVAKQVTLLDSTGASHVALALRLAASWVGCNEITLERVEPKAVGPELVRLLRTTT